MSDEKVSLCWLFPVTDEETLTLTRHLQPLSRNPLEPRGGESFWSASLLHSFPSPLPSSVVLQLLGTSGGKMFAESRLPLSFTFPSCVEVS